MLDGIQYRNIERVTNKVKYRGGVILRGGIPASFPTSPLCKFGVGLKEIASAGGYEDAGNKED